MNTQPRTAWQYFAPPCHWATDTGRNAATKEKIVNFIDANSQTLRGLLIHGNFRTGKTRIALDIIEPRYRSGRDSEFLEWTKFTRLSTGFDNTKKLDELVMRCKSVDILLIDDMLCSTPSHATLNAALEIISHRIDHAKTTIITSNHSIETMLGIGSLSCKLTMNYIAARLKSEYALFEVKA